MESHRRPQPKSQVYKNADQESSYQGSVGDMQELSDRQVSSNLAQTTIQCPKLTAVEMKERTRLLKKIRSHILELSAKLPTSK